MKSWLHITRALRRDTRGAALVELSIVVPLFLLLIYAIIEYGRLYWNVTTSQKAMQIAARLATVGPAQCPGVPTVHEIAGSAPTNTKFGTLCRNGGVCQPVADITCTLDTSTAYGARVWDSIERLLPIGTTPNNVQFVYSNDLRLGFLGGPYTPVVTAELINVDFDFAMPIAPLAASDPSIVSSKSTSITIPAMSTSVPGEDLSSGIAD